MSNSRDILNALLSENIVEAKNLINEALFARLGDALEEKLVEYAPTVFNEAYRLQGKDNKKSTDTKGSIPKTKKEKELAAETPPKNRITQGDVIAKKQKSEKVEENYNLSDADEMLIENFQNEIFQIVREIQEETGEELTEKEIQEIAEEYLQILESTEE